MPYRDKTVVRKSTRTGRKKKGSVRTTTRGIKKQMGGKKTRGKNKKKINKKKLIPKLYGRLYMNGCYHCEKMESDWKKLKSKTKDVNGAEDIESAMIPGALDEINSKYQLQNNEEGKLQVRSGYPTIYRIIGNGQPVDYYENGDRSYNSMKKWLYSYPEKVIHSIDNRDESNKYPPENTYKQFNLF
jgi:hypothetical protein